MPRRVKWSICDYKDEDFNNQIDYSEVRTEPGLVLSMRDIFRRYAAQGINLLEQELPADDGVTDVDIDEVDEMSDMSDLLYHHQQVSTRQVSKVDKVDNDDAKHHEGPSGPEDNFSQAERGSTGSEASAKPLNTQVDETHT